jgi:hypothetical protein
MVNVLEREIKCTGVQKSEGKNRFLGNRWTTLHPILPDFSLETGYRGLEPRGVVPRIWATWATLLLTTHQ